MGFSQSEPSHVGLDSGTERSLESKPPHLHLRCSPSREDTGSKGDRWRLLRSSWPTRDMEEGWVGAASSQSPPPRGVAPLRVVPTWRVRLRSLLFHPPPGTRWRLIPARCWKPEPDWQGNCRCPGPWVSLRRVLKIQECDLFFFTGTEEKHSFLVPGIFCAPSPPPYTPLSFARYPVSEILDHFLFSVFQVAYE